MSTVNFSAAQAAAGFFGFFDTSTTAGRRKWSANNNSGNVVSGSDWTGYLVGSSATLRAGGGADGAFDVSVDGGAWTNLSRISGTDADAVFQLFTGLTDGAHLVCVKANSGFGNAYAWTYETGNFLSVTGSAPAIAYTNMEGAKWMVTDPSAPLLHTLGIIARPSTDFAPSFSDTWCSAAEAKGGEVKIRARCTDIWLFTADTEAYWSVDRGAMQQVTLAGPPGTRAWRRLATGLDGTAYHDYLIAAGSSGLTAPVLGVTIGGASAAFAAVPPTKKVIQYGDSITQAYAVYSGQTDAVAALHKDAAALGFIGASCGLSGQTSTGLLSRLSTIRAYRGIVEDVAILAIGRNDGSISQATEQSNITSIINALLSAGVPKIIVRGQNFGGAPGSAAGGVADIDQYIINAVTALANSNVIYVSPQTWTTIPGVTPNAGAGDGTHPFGNSGYSALAAYEAAAYSALGLFSSTTAQTINAACAGAVTSGRAIGRRLDVGASSVMSTGRKVSKSLAMLCASAAAASALRAFLKSVNVGCISTVSMTRSVGKRIAAAVAGATSLSAGKAFLRVVVVACASSVTAMTGRVFLRVVSVTCISAAGTARGVGKVVPVAAGFMVTTGRAVGKMLAISSVSLVAVVRQVIGPAFELSARVVSAIGMARRVSVTARKSD